MSLLTSFTRPRASRQFPAFVEPFPLYLIAAAGVLAANNTYLQRLRVEEPILVSKAKIVCSSAAGAGNVNFGIYTSADAGVNVTKAVDGADIAVAPGIITITLDAAYQLIPGIDYWAGPSCTEATSTFGRLLVLSTATGGDNRACVLLSTNLPAGPTATASSGIAPGFRLEV